MRKGKIDGVDDVVRCKNQAAAARSPTDVAATLLPADWPAVPQSLRHADYLIRLGLLSLVVLPSEHEVESELSHQHSRRENSGW